MFKSFTRPFIILLLSLTLPFIGYSQLPTPVWVNDLGGPGLSKPTGLVTDNQNNIYVTGLFNGTVDFDPSAGVKNLTPVGDFDSYIAKYTPAGVLVWATPIGGSGLDQANCMTVDPNGNVTIIGEFQSPVLTAGTFNLTNQGAEDIFIIHLDVNGNVNWARSIASNSTDRGEEVSADAQGNVTITSIFQSSIVINGNTINASNGGFSGLVVKYDINGNVLWNISLGNTGDTQVYGNNTDSNGNIVVSGVFTGQVDFDPLGTHDIINAVGSEYFVAKYSPAGKLLWVNTGSGSPVSNGSVVSVDSNNDVYFSASFTSPFVFGATTLTPKSQDIFLVKYSSAGALQFAEDIGGNSSSIFTYQMRNDPNNNNLYITGFFSGTIDFDPSAAIANVSYHGQLDFFIGKYDPNGNYLWAFGGGSPNCDQTRGVELGVDHNSNLIAGGSFCSTVEFDPSNCTSHPVTAINFTSDTYIAKYTASSSTIITNNILTAPNPALLCGSGDPAVITATTPTGGSGTYTYQWQSSSDGASFTDISGATSLIYDPVAINATTYYRRIVSSTCAVPLISNIITIQVQPALANNVLTAPALTTFCTSGDPANITGSAATGGNGTYNYQWQSSSDGTNFTNINGATSANYDPPAINVTTYYRRVVTSGACTTPLVSAPVVITINTIPPSPSASPANICAGSTATLSVLSPQPGATYDWYDSPAKTNHLFTGTSYTTNSLNTSQTFYIEATGTAGCTSAALGSVQVNVSNPPASPVVTGMTSVCNGTSASLSIQNPQAGFIYNWYAVQSGGNSVFTGSTFITPAVAGSVTYYVDATNGGGCTSTRTPVNLSVNPQPDVSAQGMSICPGTTTTLTATSTDNNVTINWYANASGGSPLFAGASFITPALNSNTTYYVEAVDNITGCASTVRAQVQVQINQPLATPEVIVSATTTNTVTFQWTAVGGATGYQVSTDGGQTFTDPSSGSNGLTHTVSGLQAEQSVTIIVRAIGGSSCAQSDNSIAVTGTAASPLGDQVFVPNAFTPNGDGKNDIVYVRGPNIRSLKFYVYDQWGEMIYSSVNQANGWDGTYKGSKEPVGVYVYYVEAIMNDGKQVSRKGTITLLR